MNHKFYDSKHNRLVFVGQAATPVFWDKRWSKDDLRIVLKSPDFIVVPTTKKYLKPGSKILEGGCGHGTFVYKLTKANYKCIGVDYAKKTIEKIKRVLPELDILYADLTKLPFENETFDGYWSIGVIEHFFKGYGPITREMYRVIKKGGYLFLTFPYMSPLRILKGKLGAYPIVESPKQPENFYQFALNKNAVIKDFEKAGFSLVSSKSFDGFRGLLSDAKTLSFIIKPIDDLSKKNRITLGLRFLIGKLAQPFAGHSILLVFRKK